MFKIPLLQLWISLPSQEGQSQRKPAMLLDHASLWKHTYFAPDIEEHVSVHISNWSYVKLCWQNPEKFITINSKALILTYL